MTDKNDSQLDQYWEALQRNQLGKAAEMRQQLADGNSDNKAMRLLEALNDARLLLGHNTYSHADTGKQDQTIPETPFESHFQAGSRIGDYELLEKIAEGGMGIVFVARQCSLQRNVAIKLIKSGRLTSAEDRRRFKSESMIGSQLKHPGVVQIYDNGVVDGVPYFSMELINGKDLSQTLKEHPLDPETAAQYLRGICDAVHAAHDLGILHRDLKPSNILIDAFDAPRITDFGLAKLLEQDADTNASQKSLTMSGTTIGTPSYMSPEQALGFNKQIGRASDVYSIGAILYECITGRPPFRADTPIETLRQVVDAEPAPPRTINRNIPRDLETICLKALQKNQSMRYRSAADFAADLSRFLAQQPIKARPVSMTRRLTLWCNRNRALAASIAMLICSLVAGTIISTMMWIKSENNLALQKQTATDLTVSRTRLKDAVGKFQSKVFSAESLHWQMSGSFRTEMFRDVIDYLDEFAQLDANASSLTKQKDDVAQDYLQIADVALAVGNFDEAELASRRAYERIKQTISRRVQPLADDWLLKSKSERILFLSRESKSGLDASLLHTSAVNAKQACDLDPMDVACFVNWKESEYQLAVRDRFENQHSRMKQLANDLSEFEKSFLSRHPDSILEIEFNQRRELIIELTIRLRMHMLNTIGLDELTSVAEELYGQEIDRLRELYRLLALPMTKTDHMRAEILETVADRHWSIGNRESAIEEIEKAIDKYEEALEPNPQYRIWRLDLANCLKKSSAFYQSQAESLADPKMKNLELARERTNSAIKNYMYILETDAKDASTRLLGVKQFIRYAILSRGLQQHFQAYRGFYTAAQELNLLLFDEQLPRYFELRAKLLACAFQHLRQSEQRSNYDSQLKIQTSLLKRQASSLNQQLPKAERVDLDSAVELISSEIEIGETELCLKPDPPH